MTGKTYIELLHGRQRAEQAGGISDSLLRWGKVFRRPGSVQQLPGVGSLEYERSLDTCPKRPAALTPRHGGCESIEGTYRRHFP